MKRLTGMKFLALIFLVMSIGGCGYPYSGWGYPYSGCGYPYREIHSMGIQKDYEVFIERNTQFPISYRIKQSEPEEARTSMSPSVYIRPVQGTFLSDVQ